MRPSRLSGARIVRWCGIFGIPEGTARVALHRMVTSGELTASDGVYELAGRMQARQPAQDWSLTPKLGRWTGEWLIAAVVEGGRSAADRTALRDAMRRARLVEYREGMWIRPDNVPRAAAPSEVWDVIDEQCTWWTGRPDEDAHTLAGELFATRAWATRAQRLDSRLDSFSAALPGNDRTLAAAFEAGASALAHIRADPLLPPELCPAPWPGDGLRSTYRTFQPRFAAAARDWFRSTP
jgi:phenylacetic acid degradation operon negative regulatory protein